MTVNVVQAEFARILTSCGFGKKGGAWYQALTETILVVELQKSNYSPRYYVNLAVWFRALGDEIYPKPHHGHVQWRLTRLVDVPDRVDALLDLGQPIPEDVRRRELSELLESMLHDFADLAASVEAMLSPCGVAWRGRGLTRGSAMELLGITPGE